jgi:hypothetical protein
MIRGLDYFYDAQTYRFLEQFIRAFSGFKYMTGSRAGQPPTLKVVPCHMAQTDSMVASIMRNQSDNALNSAPMICVYISSINGNSRARLNPAHVDTVQVVERAVNQNGEYTGERGKSYTVRRLMPVPFLMTINVDVWTTNLSQKLQLFEQIAMTIGSYFDIQNSENSIDWSAGTTATVRDDITWSTRTIPIGGSDEIDIMQFVLEMPYWLAPPAEVKQQILIEQIVANLRDQAPLLDVITDEIGPLLSQTITTPGDFRALVQGDEIILVGDNGSENDNDGNPWSWADLLSLYGAFRPAASQIILKDDIEQDGGITGTLQMDDNRPNVLYWQVNPMTLPANTLDAIDGVIDPMKTTPNTGLPVSVGSRYLIVSDIGPSQTWGAISARAGDIIEYDGTDWSTAFKASENEGQVYYLLNTAKATQMKWDGEDWVMAIDKLYYPGYWRLKL